MTSTTADEAAAQRRKVIIGTIVGALAGLGILAAIYFLFLKDADEPHPTHAGTGAVEEVPQDAPADAGAAPGDAAFDSIEPLIAREAGPYTLTQTTSDRCEPPCVFPDTAHVGSIETMQATWDAGDTESAIYGEFLLYGTAEEAQAGLAETTSDLQAQGYSAIDSFTIEGVTGTTYQDDMGNEVLVWGTSNLIMGLAGQPGYPTEFVGYLNP